MATKEKNQPAGDAEKAASTQPQMSINGQYIKDLSLESPGAPYSLTAVNLNSERPAIDINVDLKGNRLEDDVYELLLIITAKAAVKDKPLFLVELNYGGIFTLKNFAREQLEATLFSVCPNLLFPYARRIISDVTRDAGFPPLMLDPMDFHSMYLHQRKARLENAAAKNGAETTAA